MRSMRTLVALMAILFLIPVAGALRAQLPVEECSDTEAWIPTASDLPGRILASAEVDGKLYIIRSRNEATESLDSTLALARLDGDTWTTVSDFLISPGNRINEMVQYNGELYVSGNFGWVNHMASSAGLVKWNGTAWTAVPGITMLSYNGGTFSGTLQTAHIAVYNSDLAVAGAFGGSGGDYWGVELYNGSTWRRIGHSILSDDTLRVYAMSVWRNQLIIGGLLRDVEGLVVTGTASWDGSAWSSLQDSALYVDRLVVYGDKLYSFQQPINPQGQYVRFALKSWDGTSWGNNLLPELSRDTIYRWYSTPAAAVHNGKLYILGTSLKASTLPVIAPVRVAVVYDGNVFRPIAGVNVSPKCLISYGGQLYAGGDFTYACSMPVKYFARLCDAGECVGISGRVVEDMNGDCDHIETKPGLQGNIIEILPGPAYVMTDSAGGYRFMRLPGTYTLRSAPPRYYRQTCPVAGASRTLVVIAPGAGSKDVNFVHTPIPNIRDVDVSLTGTRVVAGGSTRYTLVCVNRGTTDLASCDVRLYYNPQITFDSASTAPSTNNPALLTWTFTGFKRGERRTVDVYFTVPTTAPLGSEICAVAGVDVENIKLDASPRCNFDTLCQPIRASHDPNDLAVMPGKGDQGWIAPDDSVLTYTIRFQNTGNDTAYRVIVVDTLSQYLDRTSLLLGPSSHPSRLKFDDAGALIWIFDGIELPEDSVNPAASQGYVKFSVALNHGLAPNTEIINRASIYFDYNNPVVTNTVQSTTTPPSSVPVATSERDFTVYPNPARDRINVHGELPAGSRVRLENLIGAVVRTTRANDAGEISIDAAGLPAGTYIVRAETSRGDIIRMVTLVR